MRWVMLVAAIAVVTGALMNGASAIAKEVPGDRANNPYGWAGSKFWRAGVIVLITAIAIAIVQAAIG